MQAFVEEVRRTYLLILTGVQLLQTPPHIRILCNPFFHLVVK